MLYRKLLSFVALGAVMFGAYACASDNEDEPIPPILEDSNTIALRALCKRYNLPENEIMALNGFYGAGQDNIAVFFGSNDLDEAAFIICDTMANKAIYSNFNLIKFNNEVEFSMPYGEKKTLPFNAFQVCDFAIDGTNMAVTCCGLYGDAGVTATFAFQHFRLLYINGKMMVVRSSQDTGTLFKRERVIPWYDGGSIFYFDRDYENPDSRLVACYDNGGNLCYEAAYPYSDRDYTCNDLFKSQLIQPLSNAKGLGVNHSNGTISLFVIDIQAQSLLWFKNNIAIESYNYKDSDRVALISKSFGDGILTFTVEVTTYVGIRKSYNVAVTSDGEVSFPQ